MKTFFRTLISFIFVTTPAFAFAAGTFGNVSNFADLITIISSLINRIIPLIISLTVLVFIWGIFKLVLSGDDEGSRTEARSLITFGIISLFVMVSVWGLVHILTASFFGNGFLIPQLK